MILATKPHILHLTDERRKKNLFFAQKLTNDHKIWIERKIDNSFYALLDMHQN